MYDCNCYKKILLLDQVRDLNIRKLNKNYKRIAISLHPDKCNHPNANKYMQLVSMAHRELKTIVKPELATDQPSTSTHDCLEYAFATNGIKNIIKGKNNNNENTFTHTKPEVITIDDDENDYTDNSTHCHQNKSDLNNDTHNYSNEKQHTKENTYKGKQKIHKEQGFKDGQIEQIIDHFYRPDGLKFRCKWKGYIIKTLESLNTIMLHTRALKMYLADLQNSRPRKFGALINKHPILGDWMKEQET